MMIGREIASAPHSFGQAYLAALVNFPARLWILQLAEYYWVKEQWAQDPDTEALIYKL
jgi:hypothetical protein